MNTILTKSIHKLLRHSPLTHGEFAVLLKNNSEKLRKVLAAAADETRRKYFGNRIFIRGLIEFTNYCHNNCFYCGIRCDNKNIKRYRLTHEDILSCCHQGYLSGFRTFVLQGGEDTFFTDEKMIDLVTDIRNRFPDCAITLSLGERSRNSYRKLFNAGADRYLLRHETADESHYGMLHPDSMSYKNRMYCLKELKAIGYQTGCGFMVGSPFQTTEMLAADLCFIQDFRPHMVGIGPFISHQNTPFSDRKNGTLEDTLLLISILRLMQPALLLPSTTALGTIAENGRELGILAGANVIMPNLSPASARKQYSLYDNKPCTGEETLQGLQSLDEHMKNIGFQITVDRGDFPEFTQRKEEQSCTIQNL